MMVLRGKECLMVMGLMFLGVPRFTINSKLVWKSNIYLSIS